MGDFIENKKQEVKEKESKKAISMTPIQLLTARMTKEATELLCEQIINKYKIYTTRNDENSECWIYIEGIFKPEGKTYIKEHVRIEIEDYYSIEIINRVIAKIEADTYIEQEEFFNKQNKHPNLIPVINGVLNINDRTLNPHSPDYCFFNKLPVTYDSSIQPTNIIKFIESILPEQESILTLQEFYGSCLLKEYQYEKCLLVVGGGSNGKSKVLELLKYLLGMDNIAEISPQAIEDDMFAKAELINKMANISGDISSNVLKNTAEFKDLTGRGLIQAARKFKTRVKFINYAKFIYSANEVPITYDLTDGFFRRWIILDFPYRFLDIDDINEVPENEREFVRMKDTEIIRKLITPEEISGFLNWCLDGYSRLQKTKKFSNSQTIQQVRRMWMQKSSSILAFIDDNIEEDFESMISKQEFKEKYIKYCREHKIRSLNDKIIHNILTTSMAVYEIQPYNDGENRLRYWKGIRFKNFLEKLK